MSMHTKPNTGVMLAIAISLMTVISAVASLNMAIPEIAKLTGASQTQLTWVIDAYTVVFAGLLLLAGAVSDRAGRKTLLQLGLAVYAIANVIGIVAGAEMDPRMLIAIRAITGIGAAMIMPSTLSIITTAFTAEERVRAVGTWVSIAAGGAVVGIFGTSVLLIWFGWTSFFWLNLVLALIGFVLVSRNVQNSRAAGEHPLDLFGGVLSVFGVAALIYGIIEGPDNGWTSSITFLAFGSGILVLTSFVIWELSRVQPLLDPRLFLNRGFSGGSISITVQFAAQFGFIFIAMQYLQYVAGFEPWQAAIHLFPLPIVALPTTRLVAKLSKRFPQKILGSVGLSLFAAAMYLLSNMNSDFNTFLFETAVSVMAAGVAFAAMPATTAISTSLPEAKQGVASAVNDVSREFGSAIGIAILGAAMNDKYRASMTDYVNTVHFPPELPTDKIDSFTRLVTQSPAVLNVDLNHLPSQIQPAKTFLTQIWDGLQLASANAFSEGSAVSLRIAALIALVGAVLVAIVAPRKVKPSKVEGKRKTRD